jgi:hypothetical protein
MVATQPTLAGFINFVRTIVGISTEVLPDDSPFFGWAFAVALAIVNPALRAVCVPSQDSTGAQLTGGQTYTIFALAVFNLAADNLFNYAQDPTDAEVYKNNLPYFAFFRNQWNINGFVSGVISGSSDETTSQTLVVQEAAKNFTLANLQNLKTPYGRAYLGFAQDYGPSSWGMN